MIRSISLSVDRRWAMASTVLPCITRCNAAWIEAWYEDGLEDPGSVPEQWARIFEQLAGNAA